MASPIKTTDTGEILIDPMVIEADPDQPRREFDPSALRELTESIAAVGLIEPLVVTTTNGVKFFLVAGERRLRACRMGRKEQPDNEHFHWVPVRIRANHSWADLTRIRVQLDENRIREGLQPGEIAVTYRNAKLLLELQAAESALATLGAVPEQYVPAAAPTERQRLLKNELKKKGIAWPMVPWADVFKSLGQPVDRRVMAILRIPNPVLMRCDELGLTKTAASTLSTLNAEETQLAILDVVAAHKDKGLIAPMVDLLHTDPSLKVSDALQMVLQTRQVIKEAKEVQTAEIGHEPTATVDATSNQQASAAEYDQAVVHLRTALAILESHSFTKYQAGSITLLLERVRAATQAK